MLRSLEEYGPRLGIYGFEDCEPTIEFLETFFKWFNLHNIKSTTYHIFSRDANRMPFYSTDDER